MTEQPHPKATRETRSDARERAEKELARDRRVERLLLWKAVLALLAVIAIAYIRHRYFL